MITENICCNCRFYEGVKGAHGCAPCKANRKMTTWDDSCEKIWLIPERLTIVKPTEKDRCIDCANYLVGDPCHVCEFIQKAKTITNADRFREMEDEKIAEWMLNKVDCQYCPVRSEWCMESEASCRSNWLNWLKEAAD